MKKWTVIIIAIIIMIFNCKKKEKFVQPDFILKKWAEAVKNLKYEDYKKYEAQPKSKAVFKTMYSEYYLKDLTVIKIEDLDKEDIRKSFDGRPFIHRNVYFEAIQVKRITGKPVNVLKGDILFIKFTDKDKKKNGWLMSNRTIIRVKY